MNKIFNPGVLSRLRMLIGIAFLVVSLTAYAGVKEDAEAAFKKYNTKRFEFDSASEKATEARLKKLSPLFQAKFKPIIGKYKEEGNKSASNIIRVCSTSVNATRDSPYLTLFDYPDALGLALDCTIKHHEYWLNHYQKTEKNTKKLIATVKRFKKKKEAAVDASYELMRYEWIMFLYRSRATERKLKIGFYKQLKAASISGKLNSEDTDWFTKNYRFESALRNPGLFKLKMTLEYRIVEARIKGCHVMINNLKAHAKGLEQHSNYSKLKSEINSLSHQLTENQRDLQEVKDVIAKFKAAQENAVANTPTK